MDVVKEVKKLNLPFGKYVVIGSAVMAAKGIREARDIELRVTDDLIDELRKRGWKRKLFFRGFLHGKCLKNSNDIEVYTDYKNSAYYTEFEDLFKKAEFIDGVPFMPLDELVKLKRALGREKDFKDIVLIEEYLKTHRS